MVRPSGIDTRRPRVNGETVLSVSCRVDPAQDNTPLVMAIGRPGAHERPLRTRLWRRRRLACIAIAATSGRPPLTDNFSLHRSRDGIRRFVFIEGHLATQFVGRAVAGGLVAASAGSLLAVAPETGALANPKGGSGGTPVFNPDYSALIGRSDLSYTGRITTGTQGMSVANGRFGGPVWQSDGNTLVMQLNHTDMFMFNDASSASMDHQNSGGGALGRIHIGFGTTAVFDATTKQHLSLYNGKLSVDGAGVSIDVIPNMDADAIAIRVTDNRPTPQAVTVDLAMLRDANQVWGAHTAVSTFDTIAGKGRPGSRSQTIVLEQVIQEKCDTGIAANDFYVNTAVAVTVQGRNISTVANNTIGNRATLRLSPELLT